LPVEKAKRRSFILPEMSCCGGKRGFRLAPLRASTGKPVEKKAKGRFLSSQGKFLR
jgi:hypothetical protein